MWGATSSTDAVSNLVRISIHAPRVGSDSAADIYNFKHHDFNPRSPCGERLEGGTGTVVAVDFNPRSPCGERPSAALSHWATRSFQSTLPVWGATIPTKTYKFPTSDFNPRSPCGERLRPDARHILPHQFQSTLPVWGATYSAPTLLPPPLISIHAPRVGSDHFLGDLLQFRNDFNPRSPCGERPLWPQCSFSTTQFQSTLPVWGATAAAVGLPFPVIFQSTLPVWGATAISGSSRRRGWYFNPRSPCGERPMISRCSR